MPLRIAHILRLPSAKRDARIPKAKFVLDCVAAKKMLMTTWIINDPYSPAFSFLPVCFGRRIKSLVVIISYLLRVSEIPNALNAVIRPIENKLKDTIT